MAKKLMMWKTKGMNRDLSVSAFNPEFAFENMNLRLSTNEGNTMMSWVNERGTEQIVVLSKPEGSIPPQPMNIEGVAIGTAVLNKYLVLFTHEESLGPNDTTVVKDRIYRIEYTGSSFEGILLYEGDLQFSAEHPIETLVSYESETIQKVYWTDGNKQPRVINIMDIREYTNDSFDFIRKLQLEETIFVEKVFGKSGIFAPGVIQYAFTYYTKYGQESSIFYTTPLLYVSYKDRGASPEDRVENAFRITINKVDENFDYIRIYSIQRTSINGTPICKRIQDIAISGLDWIDEEDHTLGKKASYTDTGMSGDSVDPTELLYKGGEVIKAGTLESKDNTLFIGNIEIDRASISNYKSDFNNDSVILEDATRSFLPEKVANTEYDYSNQLTSTNQESRLPLKTVPCAGFREFDYYRCGIQFQHETGKWSEPLWIGDHRVFKTAHQDNNNIVVPVIKAIIPYTNSSNESINKEFFDEIQEAGYKRMRPVVVFPELTDRCVVCQGVMAPTVYTTKQRDTDKSLYAQSSWFFRPYIYDETGELDADAGIIPKSKGELNYNYNQVSNSPAYPSDRGGLYNPKFIRRVEIEGDFSDEYRFNIDRGVCTFHSPDIEFDDQMSFIDFSGVSCRKIGTASFTKTLSDINIQTETPVIGTNARGFIHKNFSTSGPNGIVSGLFYDDYVVDDLDNTNFGAYEDMVSESDSAKWMVYPWQANGSLNNDINRPATSGTASAILKKKVISNLRYTTSTLWDPSDEGLKRSYPAKLFSSDEVSIVRFEHSISENDKEDVIYMGNIDTMLTPDNLDGKYFAFDGLYYHNASSTPDFPNWKWDWKKEETLFDSNNWFKTFNGQEGGEFPYPDPWGTIRAFDGEYERTQVEHWDVGIFGGNAVGYEFRDLVLKKSPVRMKYKSTPHLIGEIEGGMGEYDGDNEKLQIFDLLKTVDENTIFGGQSADAFRENTWLPCGEPVSLTDRDNINVEVEGVTTPINGYTVYFDYGDTYYQRWDCLKTYPFTKEDINQIIEIGSFMLETHVNIDGRYDRNRGLQNNLNISPQNFNLINQVYSQKDNFFSYKMLDEDYYSNNKFPNQITWSKTKTAGADVDAWTNITLASILEMDGDKGSVNKLIRFNNQLLCLQDSGLSQILYNENVQVSSTQGVPIEIANSGKVDGKRYISDIVGCKNKWSVTSGAAGIYFIDGNEKSIYLFNGQLDNLSTKLGMNSWCKNQEYISNVWDPVQHQGFVSYYDKKNQEVQFIGNNVSLAFSEKLAAFTSFYDYGGTPYFCNLLDIGIWVRQATESCTLWQHQAGEYCDFFGTEEARNYKPYGITLVGNPEPQLDKIFTNLEFRACVDGDGQLGSNEKFTFSLPFDSLETWDEYQHGYTELDNKSGHSQFTHHTTDMESSLKRKFRMWRCDIPRNNCQLGEPEEGTTWPYSTDKALGISRHIRKPLDRMRNPWLYLKLWKSSDTNKKTEIHDVVMTYFN